MQSAVDGQQLHRSSQQGRPSAAHNRRVHEPETQTAWSRKPSRLVITAEAVIQPRKRVAKRISGWESATAHACSSWVNWRTGSSQYCGSIGRTGIGHRLRRRARDELPLPATRHRSRNLNLHLHDFNVTGIVVHRLQKFGTRASCHCHHDAPSTGRLY
jgi:hypothetical protein